MRYLPPTRTSLRGANVLALTAIGPSTLRVAVPPARSARVLSSDREVGASPQPLCPTGMVSVPTEGGGDLYILPEGEYIEISLRLREEEDREAASRGHGAKPHDRGA